MSGAAALREALDSAPANDSPRPSIVLRPIGEIVAERREPRWLLHKILERGVLAVLAGPRGSFKSFVALDWSMRAAAAGHPALILSGEGAGLDRRVDAWTRTHGAGLDLGALPLRAIERPLRLTADGDLPDLIEAIETGGFKPSLITIDTLSKYATGLDENDNSEMARYLGDIATGLRDRFDATVMLVAHSGHGDAKRPRGASALMCNPDAEYIIERPAPTAMTVTVSRERFKDYPALDPLAYAAEVIDLGRCDAHGERVASLVLRSTDGQPVKARAAGKNQQRAAAALGEWLRANPAATHIPSDEIRAVLKTQGVSRQRQPEALNWLVNARVLTAAVGGYSVDRGML